MLHLCHIVQDNDQHFVHIYSVRIAIFFKVSIWFLSISICISRSYPDDRLFKPCFSYAKFSRISYKEVLKVRRVLLLSVVCKRYCLGRCNRSFNCLGGETRYHWYVWRSFRVYVESGYLNAWFKIGFGENEWALPIRFIFEVRK